MLRYGCFALALVCSGAPLTSANAVNICNGKFAPKYAETAFGYGVWGSDHVSIEALYYKPVNCDTWLCVDMRRGNNELKIPKASAKHLGKGDGKCVFGDSHNKWDITGWVKQNVK